MKEKKVILVVDDEADWIGVLQTRLQFEGWEVHVGFDAAQATLQAKKLKPDLMLLDIMMPAGGGVLALKNLRDAHETSGIPVIIVTASGDKRTMTDTGILGISGYFTKPIEMDELIKKIDETLYTK